MIKSNKKGVSLIIALVLITVIMAFSLGVYANMLTTIKTTAAVNNGKMAYYKAEGALERGLLVNSNQGAGFSDKQVTSGVKTSCKISDTPNVCCAVNDPICISVVSNCQQSSSKDQTSFHSCIISGMSAKGITDSTEYTISGQVPATKKLGNVSNYAGMYTIPAPGTGSAGKDCDPLKANFDKKFSYQYYDSSNNLVTKNDVDPSDDACNWNKLKVGETASIPLFVSDPKSATNENPEGIKNPKDLGLNNLYIRVRTPCEDDRNINCPGLSRFSLDLSSDPKSQFGGDDPVMSWQISDYNNNTIGPVISYVKSGYSGYKWDNAHSSTIRESIINNSRNTANFETLNLTRPGTDLNNKTGKIIDYLMNNGLWNGNKINKPTLKLSIISILKEATQKDPIPYLEYQILSNVGNGQAPTDSSQTIIGEAIVGGYKAVVQSTLGQNNSITDYVIQQ